MSLKKLQVIEEADEHPLLHPIAQAITHTLHQLLWLNQTRGCECCGSATFFLINYSASNPEQVTGNVASTKQ